MFDLRRGPQDHEPAPHGQMSVEAGGSNAQASREVDPDIRNDELAEQSQAVEEPGIEHVEEAEDVDNLLEPADGADDHDDYFGQFEDGRAVHAVEGDDDIARLKDVDEDIPQLGQEHEWEQDAQTSRIETATTPPAQTPPAQLESPARSSASIPDDSPSLPSSPDPTASPRPRRLVSRSASAALHPFERRFETSRSNSALQSPRAASPAFLSPGSRQISLSSQLSPGSSQADTDSDEPSQAPWDVVRWTRLKKLTGQVFSEVGRRNFGRPTCLAVSALIAVGTTKGFVLGFDYHQTLKIIMGPGTKAAECGSVTALAISADYSTICAGHVTGHIFTWEVNRPARPFLHIPPIERAVLRSAQHPDGHVADHSILHIGFLGTRHTALVSADAGGMAFSHLASRGLGPVTRTVTSTRMLGRYPHQDAQVEKTRKPSSVLASSPLPLGNVEQATDQMGLTAMLTPYLLVIVSTTPSAQTQHKSPRPKDVSPHSTLSGCLAWFPSVKLKSAPKSAKQVSDAKLVYCWSNIISILEVRIQPTTQEDRPPSLEFVTRSRWRAEEPIVAVQWIGRSVIGALTISQRLLIIDDGTLQVTDSLDLLQRRIYHQDLFSKQLHSVVERLNQDDEAMHGVVADAFYMSFRAYKGRLFLLSFNDLAVGTVSNWADRLVALMEAGDHIAAIRLSTEYYAGSANVTIGLPENEDTRHEMVKERLLAMIAASLQYTFAQTGDSRSSRLRELADAVFGACMMTDELDFLLNEVAEYYIDDDEDAIFVQALEPYILDDEIGSLPPILVKSLVSYFISQNQSARLEELLCRLEPTSFDLDQMTTLCKQHNLYDALIFVWTQALRDYVTPLIDLLQLVTAAEPDQDDPFSLAAMKVFPYLAFTLTGRDYPSGKPHANETQSSQAKADIYEYLFSSRSTAWPSGSEKIFSTVADRQDEPAYPYVTLLLQYDASSFMSMMNEVFEDAFLNNNDDELPNGSNQVNGHANRAGYRMTRQHIITIMREVMQTSSFDDEDTIYLDMFISRNLPKYSTQLIFSGSVLDKVLQNLCHPPTASLHEDCQLSAEYLLSVYQPPDTAALITSLKAAKFYRVMKTIYRRQKLFPELLELYFDDPEGKDGVFEFLTTSTKLASTKQVPAMRDAIVSHANDLAAISTQQTALMLASVDLTLLKPVVDALHDTTQTLVFMRTIFDISVQKNGSQTSIASRLPSKERNAFEEQYIRLMCLHDPKHVADYISNHASGDLRIAEILPTMETNGVVDAEVVLLRRNGLFTDAMKRLIRHLQTLQQTMTSLLNAAHKNVDPAITREAAADLLQEITNYTKIGLWLCQTFEDDQPVSTPKLQHTQVSEDNLPLSELLWLNLLDAIVQLTQSIAQNLQQVEEDESLAFSDEFRAGLRTNVQQAFTALLVATASPVPGSPAKQIRYSRHSFLRILRAFLQRAAASSQSLSDLRDVLADIFSAYAFEQDVLTLANDLLGADVFTDIQKAHELRQRGWRPKGSACEHCKRKAWGPGIGEAVWDEYVAREVDRQTRKQAQRSSSGIESRPERGKARAESPGRKVSSPTGSEDERAKLALVLFSCRHVFHKACLDEIKGVTGSEHYTCPICTKPI